MRLSFPRKRESRNGFSIKTGFLLPAFPGISFAGMTEKERRILV